jgi:transposase
MHESLFEAALGIAPPWRVSGVRFDEASNVLTVVIDFSANNRFAVEGSTGEHPVHDSVTRTYRHLNFFQHECMLEVRTPRVRLPDGQIMAVKPPFAGRLSAFTLLFEALVRALAQKMSFASVARIAGISANQAQAICRRYQPLTVGNAALAYSNIITPDDLRDMAVSGLAFTTMTGVWESI